MRPNLKTQAKQRAKRLLRELGIQNDIPVDVEAIAKELRAKISYEALDDDTSGVIVIKGGQAAIGVNRTHHPNRQRFTIAHELGHFLLHADEASVFVDTKILYRDGNTTQGIDLDEIQANTFAAELLMPEPAVREYVDTHGVDFHDEVSIRQLALTFRVSEQAMTNRLISLGYEPY